MKKVGSSFFFISIVVAILIISSTKLNAGAPPPPPPPPAPAIPIDGGIGFLMAAGAAYGLKRVRESRKKNS